MAAAAGLGGLGLALLAAWGLLTALTRDVQVSRDGAAVVFAVGTGLLGLLVARRQPGNPEGWLLLGSAAAVLAVLDSGLYAVLDYRMHHGRLPLGETAVFIRGGLGPPLLFVVALVILLFPDGRLTRRWTWVLWLYLAVAIVAAAGIAAGEAGSIAGQHIQVDVNGNYTGAGQSRPVRWAWWPMSRRRCSLWFRCSGRPSWPARSSAGGARRARAGSSSSG